MSVNSRKLFMLVYLLQFLGLSTQELVPLEEYDSCGVCPGTIILYECAILDSTATTVYQITLPDSTNCTLKLVNSRFLGSEDGCLNNLVLARANRIDGIKYISNISITIPNTTFPTSSSIIIKCLSEDSSEPVGTATVEIISSGGFPFPGKVALATKNPEKEVCVFSIDSNCSVENYMYHNSPSTNCSNCFYNDTIFICDNVSPGETCHLSALASLNDFTSLESDPAFCSGAAFTDVIPQSKNRVAIAVGVSMTLIAVACTVTVIIIIVGKLYCDRKKRVKQKVYSKYFCCCRKKKAKQRIFGSTLAHGDDVAMGGTSGRGKDQTDDQLPEDSHASGAESSDTRRLVSQNTVTVDQFRQEMEEKIAISEQKSAEEIKSLKKQFDDKLEVITTDATKSKEEIASLREIVGLKSQELISMSSQLKEKDDRIKFLEDEVKKKDVELQKKNDELQQCIEEKQTLEDKVAQLHHDVTSLKSQMDVVKNNLDSKKEEKPTQLPDEVKSMVQLALSEFQTTLGKALQVSFLDKISVAKEAGTSNGSEPLSNTASSDNGQSSPPINNFK